MSGPGHMLAARYELREVLGSGGMGVVWRARHVALNRDVAIKLLAGGSATDESAKRRFLHEAQLTAQLKTRHAVQVFDFGISEEGEPFLVMELLGGESLRARLRREGRIAPEALVRILGQAARALDKAHAEGIVHRDFKPDNIFLVSDEDGHEQVKVLDFGVAKLLGDLETAGAGVGARADGDEDVSMLALTRTGTIVGTPMYMAPEQVRAGSELGPAVDVWALGVVACECLTGRLPFSGPKAHELFHRIATGTFEPGVLAMLDPPTSRWLAHACDLESARRFASAGSAVRALADALEVSQPEGERQPTSPRASYPPAPTEQLTPSFEGVDSGAPSPMAETVTSTLPMPSASAATRRPRLRAGSPTVLALAVAAAGLGAIFVVHEQGKRGNVVGQDGDAIAPAPREANRADGGAVLAVPTLRPALAVLAIRRNGSGDDARALANAASDMLRTELALAETLRVVPAESVARVQHDLAGTGDRTPDSAALRSLRESLGVGQVVDGVLTMLGSGSARRVRLDVTLVDTTTGDTVAATGFDGSEIELFDIVRRAAAHLRRPLHLDEPDESARPTPPKDRRAARLYGEASSHLQRLEAPKAAELLEEAARIEPGNASIHGALSRAWEIVGDLGKAAREAKRALDVAPQISREARLDLEGRLAEATFDHAGAEKAYRTLHSLFPDDVDHGLALARAELRSGAPKRAHETLAALAHLPAPLGDDPRIDIALARLLWRTKESKEATDAATRALARAKALGSTALFAQSSFVLAEVRSEQSFKERIADLRNAERLLAEAGLKSDAADAAVSSGSVTGIEGDVTGALRELDRALGLARAASSRRVEARALKEEGVLLRQSDHAAARQKIAECERVARAIDERRMLCLCLQNRALIDSSERKLGAARHDFEQVIEVARSSGDFEIEAFARDDLAGVLVQLGDVDEALAIQEELHRTRAAVWKTVDMAINANGIAKTMRELGQLDRSDAMLDEAEAAVRIANARETAASIEFGRVQNGLLRGDDVAGWKHKLEAVIALREAGGATEHTRRWHLDLAEIELRAGRGQTGELRKVVASSSSPDPIALADLAWSLAIDGDRGAAGAISDAERAAKSEESVIARATALTHSSRALAVMGRNAECAGMLRETIATAQRLHLTWRGLTAEVVAAKCRHAATPTAETRKALKELGARARSAGFGALDAETASALASPR